MTKDTLPSPVSVPEGDARADWVLVPPTATVEECGGNWCVWLDPALPYVYGFATRDAADRLARALDRALRRHKPVPEGAVSDLVERLREIRTRWENRRDWVDIVGQNYHTDMPVLFARITALEAERDTATRALADLDRIAWLAAEEDSWFGDETDIAVQRAAAERHRAALSKTEGKG